MVQRVFDALKWRAAWVFCTVHAGLIAAVYGLATLNQYAVPASVKWTLGLALGALYGGWFLAAFFVVWPLYSVVQKIRRIMKWRTWILEELPKIIALIPTLVEAIKKGWTSTSSVIQEQSPKPEFSKAENSDSSNQAA